MDLSTRRPAMARLFTLGHSTRSSDEFDALLRAHGVRLVADVRRYPGSRRHPQFGGEALAAHLRGTGVEYVHIPELGGRRTPRADSPNTAWRNAGFRAYADYMETDAFRAALAHLLRYAEALPTAIMCAEAVPWRCHRRLIADALVIEGHEVLHILTEQRADLHELHEFARVGADGRLLYPADPAAAEQMRLFDTAPRGGPSSEPPPGPAADGPERL